MSVKFNVESAKMYDGKLKKMIPMIGKIIPRSRSPFQTSSFGAIKRLGVVEKQDDGRYLVTKKAKTITGKDVAINMSAHHGSGQKKRAPSTGPKKSASAPQEEFGISKELSERITRIDEKLDGKLVSMEQRLDRMVTNIESLIMRVGGGIDS